MDDHHGTMVPVGGDDAFKTRAGAPGEIVGLLGTVPMQPAPPQAVGNYVVERELGRGAMGVVYAVRHARFRDRRFALKLIAGAATPAAQARFEREVEAIGKSRHPHLLYAVDASAEDGKPYLVTELVEGHDVGAVIRHNGRLPVPAACEIAVHLAGALGFAHAQGIVHRDVKPANIMLQPNGQAKLLDLGVATVRDSAVPTDASGHDAAGSPAFMAPEQWTIGAEVGPAADIYALGCTLHEMISGRCPFPAETHPTFASQRDAHLQQRPPRLESVAPECPAEVAALVERCLAKHPTNRPTCEEIETAIGPFAEPIDVTILFPPVDGAPTVGGSIHYDEFAKDDKFPAPSARTKAWFLRVFVTAVTASVAFVALAYFGPGTTAAWMSCFDFLGYHGGNFPRGTGFAIEAIRGVVYLTSVFLLGFRRFALPLSRVFSPSAHGIRLWVARGLMVAVVAAVVWMEFSRQWFAGQAAHDMVQWAKEHGIETTEAAEVVPYRWYFGYSAINYALICGGLFLVPPLQFAFSDFGYFRRSMQLFTAAQDAEPNAMNAIDRLCGLAQHFRRLTNRYIDTAGVLALGIQYEYWLGRWTLTEKGYRIEMVGMVIGAGIMLAILAYVSYEYSRAIDVSSRRNSGPVDHRIAAALGRFDLVWFLKSAFVNRLGGVMVLSLLLLVFLAGRQ